MTAHANPLHQLRERGRDNVAVYAVLVIGAALWLFPLVSTVRQSVQFGGFHNYLTVLTTDYNGVNLIRAFGNSLVIAALTVVLTCGIGALAGYAFSKIDFPGRETLYHAGLLLLAVPAVAIMVPVYWITGNLGLFNTPDRRLAARGRAHPAVRGTAAAQPRRRDPERADRGSPDRRREPRHDLPPRLPAAVPPGADQPRRAVRGLVRAGLHLLLACC